MHKRVGDDPTTLCKKCGHFCNPGWRYTQDGVAFYHKYFLQYDKSIIRTEIKIILNKIVEETFEHFSGELIRVVRSVASAVQLIEVVEQIIETALIEPNYMDLYAGVCLQLRYVTYKNADKGSDNFQTEIKKYFTTMLLSAERPVSETSKKKYIRATQFVACLYKKDPAWRETVFGITSSLLQPDFSDMAIESLCNLLPVVASQEGASSEVRAFLTIFSRCAGSSRRINFLKMDAVDLVKTAFQNRPKSHWRIASPTKAGRRRNRFGTSKFRLL